MKFGEKLRQLRQAAGFSQPGLAEAVGIEQSYLSKLENGKSLPSAEMLKRLMETMNISMDSLLEGIDESEIEKQLLTIPQVSSYVEHVETAAVRHRKSALILSLIGISVGFALVVAGAGALLFADYHIDYEYVSQALVPRGDNGQVYNSVVRFVESTEGARLRESGEDLSVGEYETLVAARVRELADLNVEAFLISEDNEGNQFYRDATLRELGILEAAGFSNGGSRFFVLADTHARSRPENGYLLFAGWLCLLLGAGGLVYTLLHRWIIKSR